MGTASSPNHRPELQSLSEAERQLLQRLGAALVTEWNDLPTPLQRALFDRAVQVTVRRGNDTDIDANRPDPADPVEFAFLEKP